MSHNDWNLVEFSQFEQFKWRSGQKPTLSIDDWYESHGEGSLDAGLDKLILHNVLVISLDLIWEF